MALCDIGVGAETRSSMLVAGLGAVISLFVRFRRARGTSGSRSSGSPPLLP